MKRGQTNLNFLISVNKPKGISSHDLVNRCRNIFNEGRIGHMGTLDPLAEGLMIIGVGSSTRLNQFLEQKNKTYIVTAQLGISTDTYDAEGNILKESNVDRKFLENNFASSYLDNLVGVQSQIPPAFSAIKINGKPAYKQARKGKPNIISSRKIQIYNTKLLKIENKSWTFQLEVSKGTYIRSIVNDIGDNLGCGAHITSLTRTKIGKLSLENSYSISNLENAFDKNTLKVLDPIKILNFQSINIENSQKKDVLNGNRIKLDVKFAYDLDKQICVIMDNCLYAIYEYEKTDAVSKDYIYKACCVFKNGIKRQ